jgi:hypothetical protein
VKFGIYIRKDIVDLPAGAPMGRFAYPAGAYCSFNITVTSKVTSLATSISMAIAVYTLNRPLTLRSEVCLSYKTSTRPTLEVLD